MQNRVGERLYKLTAPKNTRTTFIVYRYYGRFKHIHGYRYRRPPEKEIKRRLGKGHNQNGPPKVIGRVQNVPTRERTRFENSISPSRNAGSSCLLKAWRFYSRQSRSNSCGTFARRVSWTWKSWDKTGRRKRRTFDLCDVQSIQCNQREEGE